MYKISSDVLQSHLLRSMVFREIFECFIYKNHETVLKCYSFFLIFRISKSPGGIYSRDKHHGSWSEVASNYRVMVERYPHLKGKMLAVRIPVVKSLLYLMENLPSGYLPPMLWRSPIGLMSQKKL